MCAISGEVRELGVGGELRLLKACIYINCAYIAWLYVKLVLNV